MNRRWPGGYTATSKLAEKLFEEKAKWHRKGARKSFTRKIAVLDAMFNRERLVLEEETPDQGHQQGRKTGGSS